MTRESEIREIVNYTEHIIYRLDDKLNVRNHINTIIDEVDELLSGTIGAGPTFSYYDLRKENSDLVNKINKKRLKFEKSYKYTIELGQLLKEYLEFTNKVLKLTTTSS